jgi:hypothetical protein
MWLRAPSFYFTLSFALQLRKITDIASQDSRKMLCTVNFVELAVLLWAAVASGYGLKGAAQPPVGTGAFQVI